MGNPEIPADNRDSFREEFLLERVRDEAIIQLKTIGGKVAADIGAGTGFMSEGLLDAELKVIAVDSSQAMIDFMTEKFGDIPEFKALLSDPGIIKLSDDSVDYAFANMYLHYENDPQTAIKEIFRILKPGGKAAITDLITHTRAEQIKNHKWPGFSFPDLYDWFINAGFKNISIEKMSRSCTCSDEKGDEFQINVFVATGEK